MNIRKLFRPLKYIGRCAVLLILLGSVSCTFGSLFKILYQNADRLLMNGVRQLVPTITKEQERVIRADIRSIKRIIEADFVTDIDALLDQLNESQKSGFLQSSLAVTIRDLKALRKKGFSQSIPYIANFFLILTPKQRETFFKERIGEDPPDRSGESGENSKGNVNDGAVAAQKKEQEAAILRSWSQNFKRVMGPINDEQEKIIRKWAAQEVAMASIRKEYQERRARELYMGISAAVKENSIVETTPRGASAGPVERQRLIRFLKKWFGNPWSSFATQGADKEIREKISASDAAWWDTIGQILQKTDVKQRKTFSLRIVDAKKFVIWLAEKPTR